MLQLVRGLFGLELNLLGRKICFLCLESDSEALNSVHQGLKCRILFSLLPLGARAGLVDTGDIIEAE